MTSRDGHLGRFKSEKSANCFARKSLERECGEFPIAIDSYRKLRILEIRHSSDCRKEIANNSKMFHLLAGNEKKYGFPVRRSARRRAERLPQDGV